jgi:glycosyltransferase involved in cell wall biosynthesis
MPSKRFYYHLRPYLFWSLRIALRRASARATWRAHTDVWPINEIAGRRPDGWPGWPDGKKFAVVLTHDVEGQSGLSKCRQLMQLEQECGFRSSFNFIPEGDYAVSAGLREELQQNGFEVGVHDLHHDGKLYWTRPEFSENAKQINRYLKEWGASGFRSGFMLHNLDWLRDLDVKYDASTFDTDPFEPQPDGVNTIFPFWVARSDGSGYVELPYTLPQDSTLFLLLQERSIDIWKRKIDWIAGRGGMVLLNVHPDYVGFGEKNGRREFPSLLYRELLAYIREKYAGQYWQALPREIAEYCAPFRTPQPKVLQRRICMVSYSFYKTDNRVNRYSEALAERGDIVDVLGLKRHAGQPDVERVGNVTVHNIQGRYEKNEKTKSGYLLPILKFWLKASIHLVRKHFLHRYDVIHIHNIPDFLVFAAWLPKLCGARIILDIHDMVPEFYASKFKLKPGSFGVRVLKKVERASAWFADHVIISNHLWYKTFVARSVSEKKCSVFINHVNQKVFFKRNGIHKNGKPIIMFPGGLQWHQGLDIAIRAMPRVLEKIPEAEFHIYGDGNMKNELIALAQKLGLGEKVRFFNPLPLSQIAEVMSGADLGIVPKRADSFGNEAYSTKIMEFMSLGIPVVASSTKIDRLYFDDSVVRFFESGNTEDLAKAILDVLQNDEIRRRMIANALEYADQNSWQRRQAAYLEVVDALIENRPIRLDENKRDVPPVGRNDGKSQGVDEKETLTIRQKVAAS